MWLMPSYGRPEALRRLLDAPGGWPDRVMVLVNADDPSRDSYLHTADAISMAVAERMVPRLHSPWQILTVPAGSRFADAVREAFARNPNEPFYGIIDDDYWPISVGWYDKMVEAAGPNAISIANNLATAPELAFPKIYTCRVMGGRARPRHRHHRAGEDAT